MMWNPKLIMVDKNQSWTPPKDCALTSVESMGAFLKVTFRQTLHFTGTIVEKETSEIVVYLNDQGREVMRTTTWLSAPAECTIDGDIVWAKSGSVMPDWSGSHPDHLAVSNRFTASVKFHWEQIKNLFRRIKWHSN